MPSDGIIGELTALTGGQSVSFNSTTAHCPTRLLVFMDTINFLSVLSDKSRRYL